MIFFKNILMISAENEYLKVFLKELSRSNSEDFMVFSENSSSSSIIWAPSAAFLWMKAPAQVLLLEEKSSNLFLLRQELQLIYPALKKSSSFPVRTSSGNRKML